MLRFYMRRGGFMKDQGNVGERYLRLGRAELGSRGG